MTQLTTEQQRLARTIDELAAAGCTAEEIAAYVSLFGYSQQARTAVLRYMEQRDRQQAGQA